MLFHQTPINKKEAEMEKMLSKKCIITLILGFLLFGCFLFPVNAFAEKKMFRIGSASLGSSGYIHWEACAFLTNKYATNLKASSLSTAGSTEDVILLNDNKIELGHGTGLEIIAAWAGTKPFNKKIQVRGITPPILKPFIQFPQ